MLTRNRQSEEPIENAGEVEAQENPNSTIRIVAGEDGKFKIVMGDNVPSTPTKAEAEEHAHKAFATPVEIPPPAAPSTPTPSKKGKRGKKRATAEASTAETSASNSQGAVPKTVKKPKYERKVRPGNFDSGLGWPMLRYQHNMSSIQAQLGQELVGTDPLLIPYLANSYAYNDNLSLIRSKLRKERTAQNSKKALSRLAFNQNQNFQCVTYKPGTAFVQHQNKLGKPVFALQPKAAPPAELKPDAKDAAVKKVGAETGPSSTEAAVAAPAPDTIKHSAAAAAISIPEPPAKFVCAGCQREDAKKYAKNLCQTCYKKQRKIQDEALYANAKELVNVKEEHKTEAARVFLAPQKPTEEVKEWTGTCPDCGRSDVKHYAKGKCTNCYRKLRKRINAKGSESGMSMELSGVLATGANHA